MRVSTSSIAIQASRDTVWDVLTLPEYVRHWQYDSDLTTDWVVGGPIHFRAEWQGQAFEQWGTVLEFAPPTRLRYSLFAPRPGLEDRPENYFSMTYELTEVDRVTTVTFVHEDPREPDDDSEESGDDNPVLSALRDLAETIQNSL